MIMSTFWYNNDDNNDGDDYYNDNDNEPYYNNDDDDFDDDDDDDNDDDDDDDDEYPEHDSSGVFILSSGDVVRCLCVLLRDGLRQEHRLFISLLIIPYAPFHKTLLMKVDLPSSIFFFSFVTSS